MAKDDKNIPDITILKSKVQQSCKIKPNGTFKTYIGDRWWEFTKDEVTTVPKEVKDILHSQNALSPL